LQEIGQYLQLTQTEADRIRRREPDDKPALTAMNQPLSLELTTPKSKWPVPGDATTTPLDGVQIQVSGKNIQPGAMMRLISKHDPSQGFSGVTNPNSIAPVPGTRGQSILATFNLTAVPPGVVSSVYTIVVINPDGQTAWLDDWFTLSTVAVLTPDKTYPVILSVSPSRLRSSTLNTKGATITIKGENLLSATNLSVGTFGTFFTPIISFNVTGTGPRVARSTPAGNTLDIISGSLAILTLKASALPKGTYAINVQPGASGSDTLQEALIVS
jgi:hypothetical protein